MSGAAVRENELAARDLRQFMRRWPAGLAVVTTAGRPGLAWSAVPTGDAGLVPYGCTVNAFIVVSLRPPLVLVSLSEDSHTLAAIAALRIFCVNVLAERQAWLARRFADPAADRFADVRYRWRAEVPVLDGNAATALCNVVRIMPCADHALVFGSPRWCGRDEAEAPLVFSEGRCHLLGRPVTAAPAPR